MGIDIRLLEYGSKRLEEVLLSGEIELAASLLPVSEGFEGQDVRREPLTVLLSTNDALARRRSVDLLALRELPFILFESGFALNRIILDASRVLHINRAIILEEKPLLVSSLHRLCRVYDRPILDMD